MTPSLDTKPVWPFRANAAYAITDPGVALTGDIKPLPGYYSAIDVQASGCVVHDSTIQMTDGLEKGVSVRADDFTAERLQFTRSSNKDASCIQVDPGTHGPLRRVNINEVESVNAFIKIAQCGYARIRNYRIYDPAQYALSIGEAVGLLHVTDSYLGGFISCFPETTKGAANVGQLLIERSTIIGRLDHLQAVDLIVRDVQWQLTHPYAVKDKTTGAGLRRFERVSFIGDQPLYHGAHKPEYIDCTHNGEPI